MTKNEKILNDLRLSQKRFLHTLGVVKSAKQLAERHFPQLSLENIETAALLHDFTKEYSFDEQKMLCEKYNITVATEDKYIPKLYHAKTAAAIAKHEYFVDDETASAIYYHTTGKANMSDAETVLYFADYIEENRTDKACIKVREYYLKCLKEEVNPLIALKKSILFSFDMSIKHLLEKNEKICYEAIAARNNIINYLNTEG